VYRLCQIIDVVPWHKTYKVTDNAWSNKALKVKHGKAEKDFPMDIVSNQLVTQVQYNQTYMSLINSVTDLFFFKKKLYSKNILVF
jgi:RNA polymerase-associated protein RTF1